jgi:hypothetical protein
MVSTDAAHPRLDWHLDNWARWHRTRDDLAELACRTDSMWAGNYDNEIATASADCAQAEQVEAILNTDQTAAIPDGFTPVERVAVHHIHLGTAVYRTNRRPIEHVYDEAREKLSRWLVRKGVP